MIAALRSFFSLPLLTKELTERAARPRTYWLRIGAALLLYGGFWFTNDDTLKHGAVEFAQVLGEGSRMFEATVLFLFICIGAFVPAMLCGVITQEKERDSLVLILLTRMRPSQIALQKYLAGLVPALTILLLAMPLVAVAYAYGGVTTKEIVNAVVILVLAILQVGAVALWASCQFRTTVTAFLMTYFAYAALGGLPGLCVVIDREFQLDLIGRDQEWMAFVHVPPYVLFELSDGPRFWIGVASIGATCLLFLLLAIWQLPKRAFDRPKHRLRGLFTRIDRLFHRANKLVGSVTLGRKEEIVPAESPIVWREKRARALARPEYLIRLLTAIMIPVVLISIVCVAARSEQQEELSGMAGILAGLGILALSVTAANGIVNERVNQTFEVLLTTPMTAANILQQKVRALRPFLIVLAVPAFIVCVIEFVLESEWWEPSHFWDTPSYPTWIYLPCVLLTLGIYFPLFTWFSVWVGLWCKTRIRAIVTTLILIIIWFGGPLFILEEAHVRIYADADKPSRWLYLLSPFTVPAFNEMNDLKELHPRAPWAPVVFNFVFYGGVLFLIRRHCLKRADWYLRR